VDVMQIAVLHCWC